MLCSCTHAATVGVKGLTRKFSDSTTNELDAAVMRETHTVLKQCFTEQQAISVYKQTQQNSAENTQSLAQSYHETKHKATPLTHTRCTVCTTMSSIQ